MPECRSTNAIFPCQPCFRLCSQLEHSSISWGTAAQEKSLLGRGALVGHWNLIWVLVRVSTEHSAQRVPVRINLSSSHLLSMVPGPPETKSKESSFRQKFL